MGDIFNIFDRIKDNWREWKSIPYVLFALAGLYIWLAFKVDVLQNPSGLTFLALIFIGIFLIYNFLCAIHESYEKAVKSAEGAENDGEAIKPGKTKIFVIGICLSFILVLISSCFLITNITDKDGKYVIWADKYRISLTHNVHKSYYLSGDPVVARGEELDDYSRDSVFYLDFDKNGTFTIAHGDKFLGVTPGQNGVGYSDSCTSILWRLEEAGDGVYYIVNAEEDVYLKWYDHLQNWTTHPNITEDNKSQYLICIQKVE